MENKIVLELKNVNKSFGRKKIIKDLNLEIRSSEIFGFLGPNGAGKTTTIKMIVGLLSIDSGTIKINGYDNVKDFEKSMIYIGAIVENPDMYGYLTGYENLKLKARLYGVTKSRITEVVKLVGLTDRINDKVGKYSLGMKQRLGLAHALLNNPKIIILDEPTNGLDPSGIKELRDILKKLAHEDNICVLVSSHMLSEMQLICDKVAIINKGEIVKIDTVKEVLTVKNDKTKSKYNIKVGNIENIKRIIENDFFKNYEIFIDKENSFIEIFLLKEEVPIFIRELINENVDIYEIIKEQISLEDTFFGITSGGEKNV